MPRFTRRLRKLVCCIPFRCSETTETQRLVVLDAPHAPCPVREEQVCPIPPPLRDDCNWDDEGETLSVPGQALTLCPTFSACLSHIDISRNKIEDVPCAGLPAGLVTLNIGYNRLTRLPDTRGCPRLRILKADANDIEVVDVGFPDTLMSLDLSYNKIQDVQTVFPARATVSLSYNFLMHVSNELMDSHRRGTRLLLDHNEYFSAPRFRPSLGRYICGQDRAETVRRYQIISGALPTDHGTFIAPAASAEGLNEPASARTVYDDPENAHDAVVQRSAVDSIALIKRFREKLEARVLSQKVHKHRVQDYPQVYLQAGGCLQVADAPAVLDWCKVTAPHPIYGVSFPELLCDVVTVALQHEQSKNFLARISEEINDGRGLCLGGRIVRLVNACVGFVPDVAVQVPSQHSINTKVLHVMKEMRKVAPNQTSFNELCRASVGDLLDEHSITNAVERDAYLDPFKDD